MTDHRKSKRLHANSQSFTHDVFLSHSARDKEVVRELAEQLRGDGLRVWFDEWEIKLSDSIPKKIEDGLELSRVVVLCMSENAFGSDWATLESQTFRFRDPLNRQRRFIPLRLDDTPPPGSLRQFLYADWRGNLRGASYQRLLDACRPATSAELTARPQPLDVRSLSLGHKGAVRSVAFSQDELQALSGSDDQTVRLWDVQNGQCLRVFEGHVNGVNCVEWSGVAMASTHCRPRTTMRSGYGRFKAGDACAYSKATRVT